MSNIGYFLPAQTSLKTKTETRKAINKDQDEAIVFFLSLQHALEDYWANEKRCGQLKP